MKLCYRCSSLCVNKEQTIQYIKNPPGKSSSQYNMILTSDSPTWKIPTNEKLKYDSYIRVIRRRRGLCCYQTH